MRSDLLALEVEEVFEEDERVDEGLERERECE